MFRPFAQWWILRHSPYLKNSTGIPVEGPSPVTWFLVLAGMALTGALALSSSAFALWSEHVTTLLSAQLLQRIFAVAVFLHVAEAFIAFFLAKDKATDQQALGWFGQTFLLGYFSLGILRAKLRVKAGSEPTPA